MKEIKHVKMVKLLKKVTMFLWEGKDITQQEEQNRDKTNSQSWGNQIDIVNQEYNNL